MTDLNGPPPPIEVNGHLTPDALWQTFRVVLIFGAGWAMSKFIESEAVVAAGIAALTVLTTYGYGLLKLARTHFKLKAMASLLPDRQAVVK